MISEVIFIHQNELFTKTIPLSENVKIDERDNVVGFVINKLRKMGYENEIEIVNLQLRKTLIDKVLFQTFFVKNELLIVINGEVKVPASIPVEISSFDDADFRKEKYQRLFQAYSDGKEVM